MSISKSKSTVSINQLPKNEDNTSFPTTQTREAQISVTETVDVDNRYKFKLTEPDEEQGKNGYIGVKASSISATDVPSPDAPNMDIIDIINGNKSRTPTLSSMNPKDMNKKVTIVDDNDDNFRLGGDGLVILDNDEYYENEEEKKPNDGTPKNELAINIDKGIKKVVKTSIGMLNDLKKQKKPEDMIQNLIIDKDGKKIIDPKSLDFEYLEYNDKMKELDISKWPNYIYDQYISRKSDSVINIAYGSRLKIQQYFESDIDKSSPTPPQTCTPSADIAETPIPSDGTVPHSSLSLDMNAVNDTVKEFNPEIFDSASDQVWKLMANDSLTHFKRTKQYKQIRSFFQTVAPDVVATPRFQLGGSSAKRDDDDDDDDM
eukprot:CAMPEP_0201579416 /NCGR_PEP_ID=MMETSP0190_2-20130828/26950_1 /ASSEMBLY_ACC=CAM_ASM_000263 /TAXON_ID=37353 /ORGANISM="Rosalina sp." /LENGTH=373 /DNA_ID=CAMNT_0048013811 /DNA_START=893 /DNA_END=2014 /DNA_ORIENTATION=+